MLYLESRLYPLHQATPFDADMVPIRFTECVSVAAIPAYTEKSCVAYCDIEKPRRIKEEVKFIEVLAPVSFENSIVCRTDCTKKNFKSLVNYWPKFKPRKFSETCYVLPKYVSHSYVAFVDYHVDKERKWFTTTVQLKPKTYSNTTVQGFEMQDDPDLVDSDGEEIQTDSEDDFQVEVTDIGERDVNMNICNKGVEFHDGEPPHQESYRTHMLVNGYQPENKVNRYSETNGHVNGNAETYTSVYSRDGRFRSYYDADASYDDTSYDEDSEQISGPGHFEQHDNYNVHNGYHNSAADEVEL